MGSKNFALAFQIGATFYGNKAFSDAIVKTKELSQTMKECTKQMKLIDDAYNKGVLNLSSKINAQHQIGRAYANKMNEKARRENLAQNQGKFESSYSGMAKYAANTYQYYEVAKGIMSLTDAASEFQSKLSKVQAITGSTSTQMDD